MHLSYTTPGRVWHFYGTDVIGVYYRVINPKTGQQWQGVKRDRKLGSTVYQLADWHTGKKSEVFSGTTPANYHVGTAWCSSAVGFRSRDEAVEYISRLYPSTN
jgi:hypothetical protein